MWDSATGEELSVLEGYGCVAVSPDGSTIACGGKNNEIWLRDSHSDSAQSHDDAYHLFKSRPKPRWHQFEANRARDAKYWYGAAVHAAWLKKYEPNSRVATQILNEALNQIDSDVRGLLPSVVDEVLNLADSQ